MALESVRNFELPSHWKYFNLRGVVQPQGNVGGPKVAAVTQG